MDLRSFISATLVGALLLWVIYRRFKRTFGRQRLSPGRMIFRIGLLCLVGVLSLVQVRGGTWQLFGTEALGLAAGLALAVWASSQTRFERHEGALYYVPHTLSGVVVSALFLSRLVYRLLMQYQTATHAGGAAAAPNMSFATAIHNPFTMGLFFVLVGYYAGFYSLVLLKSRAESVGIAEIAGAPASGGTSNSG